MSIGKALNYYWKLKALEINSNLSISGFYHIVHLKMSYKCPNRTLKVPIL